MLPAPIPENDAERVASLEKMHLLSTAREADVDRIARITQKIFKMEIVLVSLIDKDRQWFKARYGLNITETPRDISFCGHAIVGEGAFVVEDATKDERFFDNPLVTGEPHVRFYAGQPLTNRDGFAYGTLCMMSPHARSFTEEERTLLAEFGRVVEVVLDNRRLSEVQNALLDSLTAAVREKLIDPLSGLWNRRGLNELFEREVARSMREGDPLVVGMCDIDHFKRINDTFGHAVGDEAIKLTAELLGDCARTTDIIARIGGEEFVFVAPKVDTAKVPILGEKLLKAFRAGARLPNVEKPYAFTMSIGFTPGVRPKRRGGAMLRTLLDLADKALYQAKQTGRDRYITAALPGDLEGDFDEM